MSIMRVICVSRGFSNHPGLVVNRVYTVTGTMTHPDWKRAGYLLDEIAPREGFCCFDSLLFRPVTERKTDITIFYEMLTDPAQSPASFRYVFCRGQP